MADKIHSFNLFNHLVYFDHQSDVFNLSQWISLITLCFAPLIAHVLAGVPSTTQLSLSSPRWHDRLPLYHPLSIVWRYLSIIDRRLRATSWDAADLAAANATFWTSYGWEGTEEMGIKSRATLTRLPRKSKFRRLASSSTMSTVVTSLQGIQAIYLLSDLNEGVQSVSYYSLNNLFVYIAVIGLLRLPAAYWITDDYGYACEEPEMSEQTDSASNDEESNPFPLTQRLCLSPTNHSNDSRYAPMGWRSIVVRLGFLLFWTAIAVYTIVFTLVPLLTGTEVYTSSDVVAPLLYLFVAVPGAIILAVYAFRRSSKGKSTQIPCVGAVWYKLYTLLWFLWAGFAVIISALETGMSPCGVFTTVPVVLFPKGYMCPS